MVNKLSMKMMVLAFIPVVMAGCAGDVSKQDAGTVIGGVTGAVIGSQFGHGGGQVVGAAVGGVVGSVAGNQIGKSMDIQDEQIYELRQQQADRQIYGGQFYNPQRDNLSGNY